MRSALSVHGHDIKVTDVLRDGDALTFVIVSQKVRNESFTFELDLDQYTKPLRSVS